MHVKFEVPAGQRRALVDVLLEAAEVLDSIPECEAYLVSTVPDEDDAVCVTEVWTSEEAHADSLQRDDVQAVVQRGMPLVAGVTDQARLEPVGGKLVPEGRSDGRGVTIRRVVPNLQGHNAAEARDFYVRLLGFEIAMEMGSLVTLVSPTNQTAQLSIVDADASSRAIPDLTIEVLDVDSVHREAERRGAKIIYPLTDESWGVRRFFVEDPNGVVVNVMTHRPGSAPL